MHRLASEPCPDVVCVFQVKVVERAADATATVVGVGVTIAAGVMATRSVRSGDRIRNGERTVRLNLDVG